MDDCLYKNINTIKQLPVKKSWKIGSNTVVIIDKSFVERLAINEDNTFFEQELTDAGILLRIKRLG